MVHVESRSLNMHQRKEISNKIIEKLISYQYYNKIIININNESTNNQQIMSIDTGYLSKTWQCSSTHTMT